MSQTAAMESVTKCCVVLGESPEIVRSTSRVGRIVAARRVICYVMHFIYGFSYPEIFRGFYGQNNNGSHTGVRGSADFARRMVELGVPEYVEMVRKCTEALRETVLIEGPPVPRAFNAAVAAKMFVDALDGDGTWQAMREEERETYVNAMRQTAIGLDSLEQSMTGALARAMGISLAELLKQRKTKSVAVRRQVICYMLRVRLGKPVGVVCDELGGIDHSTACHAVSSIRTRLEEGDPVVRDLVELCEMVLASQKEVAA